jgi:hypothetical protein
LVCISWKETVAAPTGAPFGSTTTPRMIPVVACAWALREDVPNTSNGRKRNNDSLRHARNMSTASGKKVEIWAAASVAPGPNVRKRNCRPPVLA